MPYRVNLASLDQLLESDPQAYRPLLDFVPEKEAPEEDGERVFHFEYWTHAKKHLAEHLDELRLAARLRAGLSIPQRRSIFDEGPVFSELVTSQAEQFDLEEVLTMMKHLQESTMEEVDSRFDEIPF